MDHLELEVMRVLVYENTEDVRYLDGVKHMEACSVCRSMLDIITSFSVEYEKKNNSLVRAALTARAEGREEEFWETVRKARDDVKGS